MGPTPNPLKLFRPKRQKQPPLPLSSFCLSTLHLPYAHAHSNISSQIQPLVIFFFFNYSTHFFYFPRFVFVFFCSSCLSLVMMSLFLFRSWNFTLEFNFSAYCFDGCSRISFLLSWYFFQDGILVVNYCR